MNLVWIGTNPPRECGIMLAKHEGRELQNALKNQDLKIQFTTKKHLL